MELYTTVTLFLAALFSSASCLISAAVALLRRRSRRVVPWLWWLTALVAVVSGYIAFVYWRMIFGLTSLDFGAAVLIRPVASIVFIALPALVIVAWSRFK